MELASLGERPSSSAVAAPGRSALATAIEKKVARRFMGSLAFFGRLDLFGTRVRKDCVLFDFHVVSDGWAIFQVGRDAALFVADDFDVGDLSFLGGEGVARLDFERVALEVAEHAVA